MVQMLGRLIIVCEVVVVKCRSIDIKFIDSVTDVSTRLACCATLIKMRDELAAAPSDLCSPLDDTMELVAEELERVAVMLNMAVDSFRDDIHAIVE